MLIKAWLSSLQRQLVRETRNAAGLRARRRDRQSDSVGATEQLEERSLLTALVINSQNLDDFANVNEGIEINNSDLVGFDSLVIESVAFGGINTEAIDIDLSGINLRSLAIENVDVADYVGAGIDINLNNITGLETLAIEDTSVNGDGVGAAITLRGGTDVEGLTVDDSELAGLRITANPGSEIGHGAIVENRLTGGLGVEGLLLEVDQANADNFFIVDNERISSATRDALLVDLHDSPSDGITISGNTLGADDPIDIEFVVDGDTFSQPFRFTNPSTNGELVTRIFIDVEPAGLEFDEDPTTGRPFRALNNTDFTTNLSGTTTTLTTLELTFDEGGEFDNGFEPGEEIVWEIDLDLLGGIERSINGAQMIGTEITFEFNDGKVISGVLVGVPGSSDASQFSQSAGNEGANGIHLVADNSPVTNLFIENNVVTGTPGSSLVLDTSDRSDVTGLIRNNEFLSSGSDGVVFNLVDGNFQGGFVDNSVSGHDGHGLLFNGEVTRSGSVERVFRGNNDTIVIESTFHELQTGDIIILQGLLDDDPTQIYPGNGQFRVTRLTTNTFSLSALNAGDPPPQFGDGVYDGGGQWYVPEIDGDGFVRGLVSFDLQSEVPHGFVQDATNTSPIVIESIGHGLTTGDLIRVSNVAGNTAANGLRTITVLDANRFQLDGIAGNGDYDFDAALGEWTGNVITNVTNGSEIVITAPSHGLASGDRVRVTGVQGETGSQVHSANGTHVIRRIDDDSFRLVGVDSNGTYTDGGSYLPIAQETKSGDFLIQAISGNSFTSNNGAGIQIDLDVANAFRADITSNQFVNNVEPGLHIESDSFGVGANLPLDPLDPTAVPDDQDISFDINVGTLNAEDGNVFDRNGDAGIRVLALDSGTGSFEIRNNRIVNTVDTGDDIFQGDGIHVRLEGGQADAEAASILAESVIDSNVIGVDAEGNDGRGMAFSMEERTRIQDLEFSNNDVVNNGDDGFSFERRDDARLNNVRVTRNTFENNAGDGADFTAQNTTRDLLDFRFDENDITNNEHYGIRISVLADARIQVDLENNTIDFNGRNDNGFHPVDGLGNENSSGGIGFFAFENVDIFMNMTGNSIVDNFGDGLSVDATSGRDQLRVIGDWQGNDFSRNELSGVRNNGIAFGTFTWTDNTFNDNGEDGVRSVTLVDTSDFFDLRVGGSELGVVAIGNEFNRNGESGLQLGQAFSAVIGDGTVNGANEFIENDEDGLKITQGGGQFVFQSGRRRSIVANTNTYTDNGDNGIDLGHDFQTEAGNQLHGDEALTQTDVVIINSNIVNNGGDGVEYLADPLPPTIPVVGSGQDDLAYYSSARSTLTIRDSSIRRNGGRGVDILNRLEEDSFINITNNDIIANELVGVYVLNTVSPLQEQVAGDDELVEEIATSYPIVREGQTVTNASTITAQPHVEVRIEGNEIESNGNANSQSRVPIGLSDPATGTEVEQIISGTLGGVVIRVGAVNGPLGFLTANTQAELENFSGVDASLIGNSFDGNFGTEVYLDSFSSSVDLETVGVFDCNAVPQFVWNGGERDAISRFDLVFFDNTGTSIDVTNGFAFRDNNEEVFKSRTVEQDPDGPFGPGQGTRRRNSTRTLADFFIGPFCDDGTTAWNGPPIWALDGLGPSAWRVEPTVDDTGFSINETLGESNFSSQVQLGLDPGELPYLWNTGGDPFGLSAGEVFNIANANDIIEPDDFEANDNFLAATDLGGLGGAFSVTDATSNSLLSLDTKGERDYYSFDVFDTGSLDVTLFAEDSATIIDFNVYWVNPDADVEERSLGGANAFPGQTRAISFNINGTQNPTTEIRMLHDHIEANGSATIIVEVLGGETSNIGGYFFGTAASYELDLNVPGAGGGGGGGLSGGGGEGGSGSGSGGGGDAPLPGDPVGAIQPVTPDPRSTGVPLVDITFNEDVLNVDIEDFVLTRDGEEIDISDRTVVALSTTDYTLDLSGVTQLDGEYELTLLVSDITDIDNNALRGEASDTWTVNTSVTSVLDFIDSEVGDGAASDDDGLSSLRAAVQEANAVAGADIINLPAGTYDLTREGFFETNSLIGDLNVTDDLHIIGAGAGVTIIDANQVDRLFHVASGVTLTLEGVTLTGGEAHDGGAIFNEGTLELIGTNIINSRAFNQGGGIYNTGTLSLDNSSVVLNSAGSRGGGIFNIGDVTAINTTISSNTAVSRGAGLFNEGTVDLNSVTVALNTGGARGGGVANEDGSEFVLTLGNTIVASNESDFIAPATGNVFATDIDGSVDSRGSNLVGFLDNTVNAIASGFQASDLLGGTDEDLDEDGDPGQNPAINPRLARLVQATDPALNGTYRHNLISGSPAIDAGDDDLYPDDRPELDQIGHPRFLDGNVDAVRQIDIGARERFVNRPVAFFTISSNPAGVDELVTFDGSGSSHTLDDFDIVLWEWDFNFDGTNFDVDATGEIVNRRFPTAGTFRVALRVTDDNSPANTAMLVQTIEIGVAPDAPDTLRPFRVTSDSTPTLVFEGGGTDFQIQVFRVTDGGRDLVLDVSDIEGNTYTIPDADDLPPGEYVYRVRGRNGAGFGDFSDDHRFRVKDVLIRTPRATEFDPTPEFRWTGVRDALRYQLVIVSRPSNVEILRLENLPPGSVTHTLTQSLPLGSYAVQVTAFDQDDLPGDPSDFREFDIVAPQPILPESVTVDPTPLLAWTDVNAPFYEVEVRTAGTGAVVFAQLGIQTTSISTSNLPNDDYLFRVRAVTANGEVGHWSPDLEFRIDDTLRLEQLAPIGELVDRTPLFTWTDVGGVDRYQFILRRQRADGTFEEILRDNNVAEAEFQLPDSERLDTGNYRWRVRWINTDGTAGNFITANFEVVEPRLLTPGRNDLVRTPFPLFTWEGSDLFVSYEIRVDNLTLGINNVIREAGLTETSFVPELPLGNGRYSFRVRGVDAEGNISEWGGARAFDIDSDIEGAPTAITPSGGQLTGLSPTFTWTPTSGAFTYNLLIQEVLASGQQQILDIRGIQPNSNAVGNVAHTISETLRSGRNFRWWVRAVNAAGEEGPYSAPEDFRTVSMGSVDVPEVPELLPEVPALVEEGTTLIASLSDQITIHPALPADAPADTTTVTLKAVAPPVVAPTAPTAAPAIPSLPAEEVVEVDSVMTGWMGMDWCAEVENATDPIVEVDETDGGGSSEVDERLLLAAGLPLLFGRKRRDKKKDKKKQ